MIANTRLEIGQRETALDLAQLLQNQEGTFICQQSGQSYVVVSKPGHSMTSLRPVGRRYIEAQALQSSQEPWVVEKISNQELSFDDASRYQQGTGEGRQQGTGEGRQQGPQR